MKAHMGDNCLRSIAQIFYRILFGPVAQNMVQEHQNTRAMDGRDMCDRINTQTSQGIC